MDPPPRLGRLDATLTQNLDLLPLWGGGGGGGGWGVRVGGLGFRV